MIEVEKGFILTPEQEKNLIEGTEFLGEKINTDVGYDDLHFSLTRKDIWLRSRNGKFELKIPMNTSIEERTSDQYEEIENENDILKYFGGQNMLLKDFLNKKEIKPKTAARDKKK